MELEKNHEKLVRYWSFILNGYVTMNQLPLIYYPTTLYWVDDDSLFLDIAIDRFHKDHMIKTSFSPKETIQFFAGYNSYINPTSFLQGCEQHEDYDLMNHLPVDLDFNKLRAIRDNKRKLTEIAVMIVDYRMPEISGIDLCAQLSSIPAKKILLTGNADFQEAINAFNKGFINYFVCKDDPSLDVVLSENIERLSIEYFIERTKPLFNHIETRFKLPQSDRVFVGFFNSLCKQHNIKEYYLSDKNGSVLLRDFKGILHYLVIHTERTLDDFVELHESDADAIFFVKSVRDRRKIPFFGIGEEMWGKDPIHWSKYFYTPNILEGREKYYWVLVQL